MTMDPTISNRRVKREVELPSAAVCASGEGGGEAPVATDPLHLIASPP
jgi:hypothetical protein